MLSALGTVCFKDYLEGSDGESLAEHTLMFCYLLTGGDRDRMTANHESYLLMASTQNDMEDWVKSIRRVIWGPFGGGEYIFKSWKNR